MKADPQTLATSLPGVFAGGDAVLGADLAVRAVAAGRIAATSIDQYLAGQPVTGPSELTAITLRRIDDDERAVIFRDIEKADRVATPRLDPKQRLGGLHSARSVLYSVDFHEIEMLQRRGNWEGATHLMITAAQAIERGGADLLVICTNTMHLIRWTGFDPS